MSLTAAAAIGLLLIWLAMLALGGLAWRPDDALLALLYAGRKPGLAQAAAFITELGGWLVLIPAAAIAASTLLYRRERRRALLLAGTVLGGRLLVEIQKWLSARARPVEEGQLVAVHSLSFPSAHAANSTITYLAIALLLFGNRIAVALALILTVTIGLSRVMLGVHWPSDVIGGWAFGLLWTLGLLRLVGKDGTPARLRH